MVKRLRYYARFFVVCLLLKEDSKFEYLLVKFKKVLREYQRLSNPTEYQDWHIVLTEIESFLQAENRFSLFSLTKEIFPCDSRLAGDLPGRLLPSGQGRMRLREAILVGNCRIQAKYSELTIDMYRMSQSLERELARPGLSSLSLSDSASGSEKDLELQQRNVLDSVRSADSSRRISIGKHNPHKHLVFRPTLEQLMIYLYSASKELDTDSAMLLYLSADGVIPQHTSHLHGKIISHYRFRWRGQNGCTQ